MMFYLDRLKDIWVEVVLPSLLTILLSTGHGISDDMANKNKCVNRIKLPTEMQGSTVHDNTVADVVNAGMDGTTGDIMVVNPTPETVRELLHKLRNQVNPQSAKVLIKKDLLSHLVGDFLVGSVVSDLMADGTLEIHTLKDTPNNFLFVSDQTITAVVEAGDRLSALKTTDPNFVSEARDYYDRRWSRAEEFTPRTPPLSKVKETLATNVGEEVATDFKAILNSIDSVRGNDDGLGEIVISLLVAARNGILLYDISRWGEDIGLASKATFSRTKTRLEEAELVRTEKVPIEVGRPRLRLVLSDDRLATVPPVEMAERAQSLLVEET